MGSDSDRADEGEIRRSRSIDEKEDVEEKSRPDEKADGDKDPKDDDRRRDSRSRSRSPAARRSRSRSRSRSPVRRRSPLGANAHGRNPPPANRTSRERVHGQLVAQRSAAHNACSARCRNGQGRNRLYRVARTHPRFYPEQRTQTA